MELMQILWDKMPDSEDEIEERVLQKYGRSNSEKILQYVKPNRKRLYGIAKRVLIM